MTIEVPALEQNSEIVRHTLVIGTSNDLEITDIDGADPTVENRFQIPQLPAAGGKVRAAETSDIPVTSAPFPE